MGSCITWRTFTVAWHVVYFSSNLAGGFCHDGLPKGEIACRCLDVHHEYRDIGNDNLTSKSEHHL